MRCTLCKLEKPVWPLVGGKMSLCKGCMLTLQADLAEQLAGIEMPVLKPGTKGWYVDREEGIFETAIVDGEPIYKDGELDSFCLDFPESHDWCEFSASALGHSFFLTEEKARAKWNEV